MARTVVAASSALLLSLAATAGCGGADETKLPPPPPLLYVTPKTAEVVAGSGAIIFTALLRGATGPVSWSLNGAGSLSGSGGIHVAYLPPASVAATVTVELYAIGPTGVGPEGIGLTAKATITVTPPGAPSLVVTPGTACLLAGSGPATFVARMENVSGPIAWSLEPAGVGTLSAASGAAVEYTPPALVAAPTFAKIIATGAGLTGSAPVTVVSQAPTATPVVETLSPERIVAGGPGGSLTVDGTGFAPGAAVLWNGEPRTTAFVGCTRLVATIPQADVALAGAALVSVAGPGAVTSNSLVFPLDQRLVARVSAASDGTAANRESYPGTALTDGAYVGQALRPVTSGDGRFVVFTSRASNLVPGDVVQNQEIFLRDTCFGAPPGCTPGTERISLPGDGLLSNDDPTITPDGRFVAFAHLGGPGSQGGIYVSDTCLGAPPDCTPSLEYVSPPADGWTPVASRQDAFWGRTPALSDDGRFVAFFSEWSLAPGASGIDVYVRDTCRGAPAGCTPATRLVEAIAPELWSVYLLDRVSVGISASGRYVSFVRYDSFVNGDWRPDMFLRDTCHGAPPGCVPSSVSTNGEEGIGGTLHGSLTPSGRFVAFASLAPVPGDPNGRADVFVRDTCRDAPAGCSPATELVSLANDGSQANGSSYFPQMSADARFVVFWSLATNLVLPASPHSRGDVFLRDTCRGSGPACTPSTIRLGGAVEGASGSWQPSISADGRVVVVRSWRPATGETGAFLIATCTDPASPGCGPSGSLGKQTAWGR